MDLMQNDIERYTYADYCSWDDDQRWELIDGVAYAMAPGPGMIHQRYSSRLHAMLFNFLKGKSCEVFPAPFDVRLNADTHDDTVVQPDLVVICDPSKLGAAGCIGAPDMVIEILSPSTSARDRTLKLQVYQRAGVREYWIVDPELKAVHVHTLENGRYYVTCYIGAASVPVHVLDGCTVDLSEVFAER